MKLTLQQKDKIIQLFPELRYWLDQQTINSELKEKVSEIEAKAEKAISIATETQKMEGKEGYTPVKGVDYDDGTPGTSYVLTESDKKDIAESIEVPVVEKVVEKIVEKTIVKEQPIVTEITKNVENDVTPYEIVDKLNGLSSVIDASVIRDVVTKKELEDRVKIVDSGMARIDGRIKMIDLRWHGGGLSKVVTDSTLSGLGTPSSPLTVVNGGGVGAWNTPAETPASDGTVTQFTVGTTIPTEVNADGTIYPPGTAWTYASPKITLNIGGAGPTQFVRFR